MLNLLEHDNSFRYQLLGRLKEDCNYYLKYGSRNPENLWASSEKRQIEAMKLLWNSFSEEDKPEWLTWEQITKYEIEMLMIP